MDQGKKMADQAQAACHGQSWMASSILQSDFLCASWPGIADSTIDHRPPEATYFGSYVLIEFAAL